MATPTTRPPASEQHLGQVLLDAGLISEAQLQEARRMMASGNGSLAAIIAERRWVSSESLAMALSLHLNIPLIDLTRHSVQPEVLQLIPEETARRHHVIPLDVIDDALAVVLQDPTDLHLIEVLTARSGMRILPFVGVREDIQTAIDLNYKSGRSIEESLAEIAPATDELADHDAARAIELTAEDPIVRAVDLMLEQAVRDHASDIHIEPDRESIIVRYRIDGMLQQALTLPHATLAPLLSRIKVLADMNIAETRRHQDGQFAAVFGADEIFFRVATSETTWGEGAVLRVLGRSSAILDLTALGMTDETLAAFRKVIQAPFGMVLVSGPTGSGKTTTLYAALAEMDSRQRNVMTVEDPVEFNFAGINQIQVNRAADITFATGLRAILRMDPDIILVGEIRDAETAETATQAALTGHLVFSSIHSNDAPGALFRLANLGVEPYMISSSAIGVVAQRLVRKACEHCRAEAVPTAEERSAYREAMNEDLPHYLHGMGCNFCRMTGYRGRTGVFELLIVDSAVQQQFMQGASAGEIKAEAEQRGLAPMRQDGMRKVKLGLTTPSEVMRTVYTLG